MSVEEKASAYNHVNPALDASSRSSALDHIGQACSILDDLFLEMLRITYRSLDDQRRNPSKPGNLGIDAEGAELHVKQLRSQMEQVLDHLSQAMNPLSIAQFDCIIESYPCDENAANELAAGIVRSQVALLDPSRHDRLSEQWHRTCFGVPSPAPNPVE